MVDHRSNRRGARPVLALGAQRVLDKLREKQKRRENLFFALLTTRASPLAQAHVQALNSIDVVFNDPRDEAIRAAWARVLEQMNIDPAQVDWFERLNDRKCDLLQKMGAAVGFEFGIEYLKRQGYLPRHYTDLEQDQLIMRKRLLNVITDDGVKTVVTKYKEEPRPPKDSS
jgi:hypothetical protein